MKAKDKVTKEKSKGKHWPKNQKSGWGPVSAIAVTIGIYFGAQLLAVVALSIYAAIQGLDDELARTLIENSVSGQFTFILLVSGVSLYLLWLFMSWRKISWKDIGVKKPRYPKLFYAIPAFAIYFITVVSVMALLNATVPGLDTEQEQQIGFDTAQGTGQLTLVFISLVILPAVVEEIMVRGFLYGGLVKKFSKLAAALIASGVFGIAHLQFGSGQPLLWVAAIDTFILSMVLIGLREKTGNVWAGVLVHMVKNTLAFISLFVLKIS